MSPYNFLKTASVLVLITIATCRQLRADETLTAAKERCPSSFQVGANYTYLNFNIEDDTSYDGNLGGLEASYEYKPWNSIYGALLVNWRDGGTSNGWPHRSIVYVDVEERLGYTYVSYCQNFSITFFTGFGYIYIGQKISGTDVNFNYNEFYVPIGLLSEYYPDSYWTLGLNFSWMPQVFSVLEITPIDGLFWFLKNSIANVMLELPITYSFSDDENYTLILKPFYQFWQDGKSTAKDEFGQEIGLPENSYNFVGVELRFNLSF